MNAVNGKPELTCGKAHRSEIHEAHDFTIQCEDDSPYQATFRCPGFSAPVEPCPHGIEDPAWCAFCNGKAKEIPAEISVKYSFKARYKGYMSNDHCNHFVEVGEMISALSDGTFVCIDCTEEFL